MILLVVPESNVNVSSPLPPVKVLPLPPVIESAPAPPINESAFNPPIKVATDALPASTLKP